MSRSLTVWTILLVLLAVPATALAQSAGDDQYSDPLAGEQPSSQGQGQPQTGTGQGTTAPQTSAPTTPSAPAGSAQSGAETGTGTAGDALPRTGLDVILLFAAAAPLLLGGFALHRVARNA